METLLTIAIPTYNRANILDGNLHALKDQIVNKKIPIEIIVSDNCSTDNTTEIVRKHIENGMDINFVKNEKNIGMDANFAQCYRKATGKYVIVLGDDDYILKGKLELLIKYLSTDEYGLVHLKVDSNRENGYEVYTNKEDFMLNVSYWITYITSNIVNTKYIKYYNFEKHFGTFLTISPMYLDAIIYSKKNLLVYDRIFADGLVVNSNGGYNFFEVFIHNYLKIWKTYLNNKKINYLIFKKIKFDILKRFLIPNIFNLLIVKTKNNYNLNNSWKIILTNYGIYPSLYLLLIKHIIKKIYSKLQNNNFIKK